MTITANIEFCDVRFLISPGSFRNPRGAADTRLTEEQIPKLRSNGRPFDGVVHFIVGKSGEFGAAGRHIFKHLESVAVVATFGTPNTKVQKLLVIDRLRRKSMKPLGVSTQSRAIPRSPVNPNCLKFREVSGSMKVFVARTRCTEVTYRRQRHREDFALLLSLVLSITTGYCS